MIFDTIAALADFSDVDFDGDVTADEIVEKLIELRENGLLNSTFENLNIAGVKQSNTQTQELKHFVRNLLAQKRTGFSEVEADMIAERVYRTRMYNEGKTVREDLASSSSSSSSAVTSSSSSSSSSSFQYTGENPGLLITLTWTDDDETKMFFGETFTNGKTHVFAPGDYGDKMNSNEWSESWTNLTWGGTGEYWWTHNLSFWEKRETKTNGDMTDFHFVHLGAWNEPFSLSQDIKIGVRRFNGTLTSKWRLETSNILSYSPTESAVYFPPTTAEGGIIFDESFGSVTNTEGLTITWHRGPDGTSKAWKVNR